MYTTVQHYCDAGKNCAKSNVQGLKENRELKRTVSEELHVSWQNQTPSARAGPFEMGKAKASRQSEGKREQKTGGSLHEREDSSAASPGS